MARCAVTVENRPLNAGPSEADHVRVEHAGSRRYLAVSFRLPITTATLSILLVCCTVVLLTVAALRRAPPWGAGSPPYGTRVEPLRHSSRPLRVWQREDIASPEASTGIQSFDAPAPLDQGVIPESSAQAAYEDEAAASPASGMRKQAPGQTGMSEDTGKQAGSQQPPAAPSSGAASAAAAAPLGNQEAIPENKGKKGSKRQSGKSESRRSSGAGSGGGNKGGSGDKASSGSGGGGGGSNGGGFTEVSTGPIQQRLVEAVRQAATTDGGVIMSVGNRDGIVQMLPELLRSMALIAELDLRRHLVVICFTEPALSACRRLHHLCVLDDLGTAPGVEPNSTILVDDIAIAQGEDAFTQTDFTRIGWRKIQIFRDILRQGYTVVSSDMDVTLFRNPLDPASNPFAGPETDFWVTKDKDDAKDALGRSSNIGLMGMRPTPKALELINWWTGLVPDLSADKMPWDQQELQKLVGRKGLPEGLRFATLNATYFPNLCLYDHAKNQLPSQEWFGRVFANTSDNLGNWDTMLGFHAPCCGGENSVLPDCKRTIVTALLWFQKRANTRVWARRLLSRQHTLRRALL